MGGYAGAALGPPDGWPDGWDYPGPPWPPGFAASTSYSLYIIGAAVVVRGSSMPFTVRTLNAAEDTALLDGYTINLTAAIDGVTVQLKKAAVDAYADSVAVEVTNYADTFYGWDGDLWFDLDADDAGTVVTVTATLDALVVGQGDGTVDADHFVTVTQQWNRGAWFWFYYGVLPSGNNTLPLLVGSKANQPDSYAYPELPAGTVTRAVILTKDWGTGTVTLYARKGTQADTRPDGDVDAWENSTDALQCVGGSSETNSADDWSFELDEGDALGAYVVCASIVGPGSGSCVLVGLWLEENE